MLDLPHAACRPRSAPDMRSRMRSPSRAPSFCFVKPVWLPRNPTRCPNTAKAPSVCTLPARSVEQTFAGAFQTRRRRGCRAQAPGRCAAASARACHPTRPHTRRRPVARPGLLHSSFCRGWTSGALMSSTPTMFSRAPVHSKGGLFEGLPYIVRWTPFTLLSPLVSLRGKAVKSDCLPVRRGYALSILSHSR